MLNTKKVINLSGKMSILGVTKLSSGVQQSMMEASNSFYVVKDIERELENQIKEKFYSKDAFVTSSATAGITTSIKAVRNWLYPSDKNKKIKVLLPSGHHIDYGAPIKTIIEFGGAEVLSIGSANKLTIEDLEESLKFDFDIAFYVSSHHCVQKKHIGAKEFIDFYKSRKIKTIIDIAAEEDIWKFSKYEPTFCIVSGSKAISGPTSGFLLINNNFEKKWLEELRYKEARTMKLSKENMFGLSTALDEYSKQRVILDVEKNIENYIKDLSISEKYIPTISVDKKRKISRIRVTSQVKNINKLLKNLKKNGVYVRGYGKEQGYIELDLRQVSKKEMMIFISIYKEAIND